MPLLNRAILAALLLCPLSAADAASADDSSHWASDPNTHCALYDATMRPGDTVNWIGECRDGRGEGPGTASFFNNGKEFESFTGNFSGGVAAGGHVTVRWGDGWSYEGDMVAGHFEGQGVLINDRHDRFEGQWKDGKLNGVGSVTHDNGERYDGEWKNDLPNGHGVLSRADGSKLEGEFADGKFAGNTPAPAATPASLDTKAAVAPVKAAPAEPDSALASLSGKKLIAVDGAALNLTAIEGGIERDITAANGALEKTTFTFINERLGTVAADGGRASTGAANVTGFFRLTDNGVEVRYADGRGEILSEGGDGGVLLRLDTPGASSSCRSFYPEGHSFSDGEKKTAVAEYAIRLGLAPPEAKPSCQGDAAGTAPPASPQASPQAKQAPKPEHHAEVKPPAKVAAASLKNKIGAMEPEAVKDSVVHAIDAMPMAAMPVTADAAVIAAPAASTEPGQHDASHCLKVESDGLHWGFRNSCGFDVQFSYCLAQGGDNLTACDAGGAMGSVSAGGFGALMADKSFSESDAEHDFRWLACGGGAGEVVAHLDHVDPPSGRCMRAGDVASNQKDGK
jgi:hypothetical protein